jgi:recombination protein RecA
MYGEGISLEGDLVDLGAEAGVVEKSGAWFGFEGDRIGQGRDNAKQYLRDHPEVSRKIESKVLVHHGVRREVGPPALAAGAINGSATTQVFAPTPKPGTDKKGR